MPGMSRTSTVHASTLLLDSIRNWILIVTASLLYRHSSCITTRTAGISGCTGLRDAQHLGIRAITASLLCPHSSCSQHGLLNFSRLKRLRLHAAQKVGLHAAFQPVIWVVEQLVGTESPGLGVKRPLIREEGGGGHLLSIDNHCIP